MPPATTRPRLPISGVGTVIKLPVADEPGFYWAQMPNCYVTRAYWPKTETQLSLSEGSKVRLQFSAYDMSQAQIISTI
ncbi:MAG: hypothetical protein AAF191_21335 [Verrucomicrobiota bacterium]